MRIETDSTRTYIDQIPTIVDVGQLCALSAQVGVFAVVDRQLDEDDRPAGEARVMMERPARVDALEELTTLGMVYGYAKRLSGNEVLELLRQEFEKRCMGMDRPLQEMMQIGGGHDHPGHAD